VFVHRQIVNQTAVVVS